MIGASAPKAKFVVLGNVPMLPQTGPDCIARHTDDLQACSATTAASETPYHHAEAEAVESVGGRYIDPTPWLCSKVCTPVIGNYDVYYDHDGHLMDPDALHLTNVLPQALQLPASRNDHNEGAPRGTDTYFQTKVLMPNTGAVPTGGQFLDVVATDAQTVTKVQFSLSGGSLKGSVIATAGSATPEGWIAGWNSASVPNGTYRLRSVAYDTVGNVSHSTDIVVTVKN